MARWTQKWLVVAALAAVGCGGINGGTREIDGGTDGSVGGGDGGLDGGDGGIDGGGSTLVLDMAEAAADWSESLCPCAAEEYTLLTEKMCTLGFDYFFSFANEFLFAPMSEDQAACLEEALVENGGAEAFECRTHLATNAAACFNDADLDCTYDGPFEGEDDPVFDPDVEACLLAAEAEREACPSLPESWESDLGQCMKAEPVVAAPVMAEVAGSICQCTECGIDGDITQEQIDCVAMVFSERIADEESGAEAQAHLDCLQDVIARVGFCYEGVSECGDEHSECLVLYAFGLTEVCENGAFSLLVDASHECFPSAE